jgi:Tfp pilus assembly protein PilO
MNKKNIISLINLIISLVLIFIFIDPLWTSVKALKAETIKQEQKIAKIENLLAKVEQQEREYQELKEQADKILLALPEKEDIPYLLVQFESLASTSGLLLESIGFGTLNEEDKKSSRSKTGSVSLNSGASQKSSVGFSKLPFDISMVGSYEALKGYLSALENNVRLMDINTISFSAQQGDQETAGWGVFQFSLGLSVYYQ